VEAEEGGDGEDDSRDAWQDASNDTLASTKDDSALAPVPVRRRLVRQYFVKLRGFSFARCKWMTAGEIEADGKLSRNCLSRFLRKLSEGEDIDTSYRENMVPARVISHQKLAQNGVEAIEYLVKWSLLPYSDCSWEPLGEYVTEEMVEAYNEASNRPAAERVAEERRQETAWLQPYVRIEVMPGEGVYAGSWCVASAVAAPKGPTVMVEYEDFVANEDRPGAGQLKQRLPLLRVRPLPPTLAASGGSKKQQQQQQVDTGWGMTHDAKKPEVGDAVQMFHAQAWWRASVRAVVGTGDLLTDERDDLKREADVMLVLQPPIDPNERKLQIGCHREGRDGRIWELCELQTNLGEAMRDDDAPVELEAD
jgi:hypothetical protein